MGILRSNVGIGFSALTSRNKKFNPIEEYFCEETIASNDSNWVNWKDEVAQYLCVSIVAGILGVDAGSLPRFPEAKLATGLYFLTSEPFPSFILGTCSHGKY